MKIAIESDQNQIVKTLEYDLGQSVQAFTTTRLVDARRTHPLPLSELTGLPLSRIVIPHQVHDTRCLHIDSAFLQLDSQQQAEQLEGIDAVITQQTDTLICISTADCIPIIIYDSTHHAAATIHAGWRGTVSRIVEQTFDHLHQTFGTQGQDCHAVIGPGISLENFEVGDEVYDRFAAAGFDMSIFAQRFEKWHINLKLCNKEQLLHCSIPERYIYTSNICTLQDPRFFSARREGIGTGRNMTCIRLNPPTTSD